MNIYIVTGAAFDTDRDFDHQWVYREAFTSREQAENQALALEAAAEKVLQGYLDSTDSFRVNLNAMRQLDPEFGFTPHGYGYSVRALRVKGEPDAK
jgi:hypothetical protein